MLRPLALGAGTALLALAPAIANHSTGIHWAGDGQNLVLRINTAIAPEWDAAVATAVSDWDQSDELTLISRTVSVDRRKCDPIPGQILVCDFPYGRNSLEAVSTVVYYISDNHIAFATTKLNDTYFFNNAYKKPGWRAITACHEIGHNLGLDHQDETANNVNLGSCMDLTNAPAGGVVEVFDHGLLAPFDYGPSNEHPNAHDYEELSIIYDHDDGFTTATGATDFGIREVGKSAPQPPEGIGDSPAEWGRAIHRNKQGRPDIFIKDLGSGQRALTHVFWANS